jgi:phosphonate degradation associated HDIG domain protein
MSSRAPKWWDDPDRFANELVDWLRAAGGCNYDEAVSQYEHAVQSAELAAARGGKPSVIVAALLHDVGHLLVDEHDGRGGFLERDFQHERVGAGWLSRTFGPDVTEPIRLHVDAKRYLCTIDTAYYGGLSESSKRSFDLQGGNMTTHEIEAFLTHDAAPDAIELRRIDDLAKQVGRVVPDATTYRELLRRALHPNTHKANAP